MAIFEENLKKLPEIDQIVIIRVYDQNDQLVSIIPNLKGFQGALKIFNHIVNAQGQIGLEEAKEGIRLFGEHVDAARQNPEKHPNLNLLLTLESNNFLKLKKVESSVKKLIEIMSTRSGSSEDCDVFIELMNKGLLRAAEKIRGIWQPQTYVIDGILNYFSSHSNHRIHEKYWDKIPLKTTKYSDEDFDESGVRYAPGSIVRTGAYIGPQTVIMNMAFVNIGAYIAGKGVMIDGASRVASCAQIGEGVKFGAGSGIEGVLEPAGRLPSIVENGAKIGAMCEVAGIIGEGAIVASGVVMASGKKILDQDTGKIVPPYPCVVGDKTFLLPVIPPYRLAVGGVMMSEDGKWGTDAVILKPGDLRDSTTIRHFEKQGILYQ
ncbi:MAG: DUF2322 family protein [SAR324 cluster bacterium]|nr:DUF2322 family protein [SAR324 cluster bacterium]